MLPLPYALISRHQSYAHSNRSCPENSPWQVLERWRLSLATERAVSHCLPSVPNNQIIRRPRSISRASCDHLRPFAHSVVFCKVLKFPSWTWHHHLWYCPLLGKADWCSQRAELLYILCIPQILIRVTLRVWCCIYCFKVFPTTAACQAPTL